MTTPDTPADDDFADLDADLDAISEYSLEGPAPLSDEEFEASLGPLLNYILRLEQTFSKSPGPLNVDERKRIWKELISVGRTRGYLTHDEINAALDGELIGGEEIESLVERLNDSRIAVYERGPSASDLMIVGGVGPSPTSGYSFSFTFVCNMKWEDLERSATDGIRFCNRCAENVFLCRTEDEVAAAERLGRCVAFVQSKSE